ARDTRGQRREGIRHEGLGPAARGASDLGGSLLPPYTNGFRRSNPSTQSLRLLRTAAVGQSSAFVDRRRSGGSAPIPAIRRQTGNLSGSDRRAVVQLKHRDGLS